MSKVWKISFSFSSLLMGSFLGILALMNAQENQETPLVNIFTAISSLALFIFIFSLLKIVQKKPRYWIRIVNKALLLLTVPLILFSLLLLINTPENPQKIDTLVNLFIIVIALWSLFAFITLIKLLNLEKKYFKEKGVLEKISSIDKKVNAFGDTLVEEHPILSGLIAVAVIAGVSIYLYGVLGILVGG